MKCCRVCVKWKKNLEWDGDVNGLLSKHAEVLNNTLSTNNKIAWQILKGCLHLSLGKVCSKVQL